MESAAEAACDQRSQPQDVTSSGADAEGSICSQRSSLTRPKDLLATPLNGILPTERREQKGTYNLTGADAPPLRAVSCPRLRPLS
jgi:hypothetical protein